MPFTKSDDFSEKSFLESKVFREESINKLLKLGISQSVQFHQWPKFQLIKRYRELKSEISSLPKHNRFVLCPSATQWLEPQMIDFKQDITLAIGPERGFTKDEESDFQMQGFQAIKISNSILRVEIAVYSVLSQLELLRSQS
ncbi:RsmE family RNA methyltransferase [bacterium]|nr:RsmE family RNA methyltransferase [bacterium]